MEGWDIFMAYWVQEVSSKGNNYANYKSFMCDKKEDILKLPRVGVYGEIQNNNSPFDAEPCACGSDCFCIEGPSVWVLSKETNEWIEI